MLTVTTPVNDCNPRSMYKVTIELLSNDQKKIEEIVRLIEKHDPCAAKKRKISWFDFNGVEHNVRII